MNCNLKQRSPQTSPSCRKQSANGSRLCFDVRKTRVSEELQMHQGVADCDEISYHGVPHKGFTAQRRANCGICWLDRYHRMFVDLVGKPYHSFKSHIRLVTAEHILKIKKSLNVTRYRKTREIWCDYLLQVQRCESQYCQRWRRKFQGHKKMRSGTPVLSKYFSKELQKLVKIRQTNRCLKRDWRVVYFHTTSQN